MIPGWNWFRQPYLANRFTPGTKLVLSGKIQAYRNRAQLQNPEYEVLDDQAEDELVHAGVMLPVYPSTEGLLQRTPEFVSIQPEFGLHDPSVFYFIELGMNNL